MVACGGGVWRVLVRRGSVTGLKPSAGPRGVVLVGARGWGQSGQQGWMRSCQEVAMGLSWSGRVGDGGVRGLHRYLHIPHLRGCGCGMGTYLCAT